MSRKSRQSRSRNLKPSIFLLLIPLLTGLGVIGFVFSNTYRLGLGQLGAERLETVNWQVAEKAFKEQEPDYGRKFAYYQLKERENAQSVSQHFSISPEKLAELNPGTLAAGATVKITPPEGPYQPITASNNLFHQLKVIEEPGKLRIKNDFKFEKVVTTLPELAEFLAPYGVFEKTGPKTYRMNRSISIEENIRIDITGATVEVLELRSESRNALCLCFENAEALIKDTKVTSFDSATNGPDLQHADERSFIRAYASTRLDVIDSEISYLGNGLDVSNNPIQNEGGTYGISWRIPKGGLGSEIVTGWVEGNKFYKNHFGSYTFGASGMVWKDNHYLENDVYGLDPHDDSNNALVEGNVFERNGKHGFIVSKRCNYNVIRNNVSFGNKLHGYMLHQDSVYNLIENNVAYDNTDNFAIFDSDFNAVRKNRSFNARSNHVRINAGSVNTFVRDNEFYGGRRGVYVYGDSRNVAITGNTIQSVEQIFATDQAQNVFLAHNTISGLYFKIGNGDRIIFGTNEVADVTATLPRGVSSVKKSEK
jgi:parallel beta-helix repeat protein